MTMNLAEAHRHLMELVGLQMWGSSRAADLEGFLIGDRITTTDRKGNIRNVSQFGVHVQCPWRIRTADRIVVAYRDLLLPRTGHFDNEFDPNVIGETLREKRLESLFSEEGAPLIVEECATTSIGDLSIRFADDLWLDVFPDTSNAAEETEFWRVLKHDSWHLVRTSLGISLVT